MFDAAAPEPDTLAAADAAYEYLELARALRREIERREAVSRLVPRVTLRVAWASTFADRIVHFDALSQAADAQAVSSRLGWTIEVRFTWPAERRANAVIALPPEPGVTDVGDHR